MVGIAVLVAVSFNLRLPGQELLQSLRFHLAAAVFLVPLGLALMRAWLRAGIFMLAVVASVIQGGSILLDQQLVRLPFEQLPARASLSVLSINVLNDNPTPEALADYLATAPADVVITMESGGIRNHWDSVKNSYASAEGCNEGQGCDIAVLSRLPVLHVQFSDLGPMQRQRLVVARVAVSGQVVSVVGLHLSKPYFDFFTRAEYGQILRRLRDITGPMILAGDFNSTAWTDATANFVEVAGLVPAPAYPATWPVELGPVGVPIDNMFSRGGALIRELIALPDAMGSNHRGIVGTIDLVDTHP
jgi:endonuclease/exonuclease/phosphatase (EEP) superfamily protein YafD